MKIPYMPLCFSLLLVPSVPAADTPIALAKEVQAAFATGNWTSLSNRKIFLVITGDIPVGRARPGDLDRLSPTIPNLYNVASVKVLSPAEARSIEAKGYAKGASEGYVAVDFVRREDSEPKAQITAFRRYYPYERAAGEYVLLNEK